MAWVLTMGPQLGVAMDPFVGILGQPGTITLRAIDNAGPVTWTLLSSSLPMEWGGLVPAGAVATMSAAELLTTGEFAVSVRIVDANRQPILFSFSVRVIHIPVSYDIHLHRPWSVPAGNAADLDLTEVW